MSRKGYGGDPTTFQLRDMQRRITSLEKARVRNEAKLSLRMKEVRALEDALQVTRAMIVALSKR